MTVKELLVCCDNRIRSEEFNICIVAVGRSTVFNDTYCKLYEEAKALFNCAVERFSISYGEMIILVRSI